MTKPTSQPEIDALKADIAAVLKKHGARAMSGVFMFTDAETSPTGAEVPDDVSYWVAAINRDPGDVSAHNLAKVFGDYLHGLLKHLSSEFPGSSVNPFPRKPRLNA